MSLLRQPLLVLDVKPLQDLEPDPLLTADDEPAEPLLTEEDIEEYLLREEEHRKGLC